MKKFLLSAIMLVAVAMSAKAQFSLGVKGGVNFSNINADNFKSSTKTGYQTGVFARFGSAFYLQPEVYLSSTGGNISTNDNSASANIKFTNLTVPVLLGYKFGPDALNFRLMAGPEYTYIVDKSESFSQTFQAAYLDFGKYNSSTIGYQAGAGVDISVLTVDLRYEGSLNKINPNFGQKQSLWALSVGFKFL